MGFNKIDFLRDLIDDVASSERAGKKFEADAAILGPLLVGVQRDLTDERERDEAQDEQDRVARILTSPIVEENAKLRERLADFMDYFAPRGGISDVPLGPFERAKECLKALDDAAREPGVGVG